MKDDNKLCATICFVQALWYDIVGDDERAEFCIREALTWAFPMSILIDKTLN